MNRNLLIGILAAMLGGGAALVACGSTPATTGGEPTSAHGMTHDFVVSSLTLPVSKDMFSIDLDGDGKVDNALSNIVQVLGSQGLDTQSGVTKSVNNGDVVMIVRVETTDPTLTADTMAGAEIANGKAMACPTPGDGGPCPGYFGGMGMFAADPGSPGAWTYGAIAAGAYSSVSPITTMHPITFQLKLALVSGAPAITLPTNGFHVQFTGAANGLMTGAFQGSVKITDLQGSVLPAVAGFLTAKVSVMPCDATCMGIESLFDTGGCTNPDGTMAKAKDNKIDLCELSMNDTIKSLLAADIEVYGGAGGTYGPVPRPMVTDPTKRDSLSLGVGFTAVPATVTGL